MKRIFTAIGAAGVLIAASIAPASAQTLGSVTGEQLESILNNAGLTPNIVPDSSTGAPVAIVEAGDNDFYVRALNCSGSPAACETLVFFATWELRRSVTESDYRIINSFNDSQVYGRAFLLENTAEVGVDYLIELGGGVTEDHLSQNISRWADVIGAFLEKFQSGSASS